MFQRSMEEEGSSLLNIAATIHASMVLGVSLTNALFSIFFFFKSNPIIEIRTN